MGSQYVLHQSKLLSSAFIGTRALVGQDPSLFAVLSGFLLNAFLTRPELLDVSETVHSLLNKEAAWLHYCTVAMSQVYKSRKFHLHCTNGCPFSFVLISPPSLHSFFLSLFFSPFSFPSFPFTLFLTKLSYKAQTLITESIAMKGCLFQLSKAGQMQLRKPARIPWLRKVVNRYELNQGWPGSLPGDGTGPTSKNTVFLASGFQFSL